MNVTAVFQLMYALAWGNNLDRYRPAQSDSVLNSAIVAVDADIEVLLVYHVGNTDKIQILALKMCTWIADHSGAADNHI